MDAAVTEIDTPRRAAIALIVKGAVICPARFLRWRVKIDITQCGSRKPEENSKGLNGAIEVFVIEAYS